MEIGAILVLADLLVGECQYLVNVVEAFGVDVSDSVSECVPSERRKLTAPGSQAILAGQSCPEWAAVAS